MTGIDLRGRYTLTVPEAGQLLGIGRDAAYAATQRRQLPSQRIGRRVVVPTLALLRQLGWPESLIAKALGLSPEITNDEPGSSSLVNIPALTKSGDLPHDDPAT
jgi:excisionase family DNA binding protein